MTEDKRRKGGRRGGCASAMLAAVLLACSLGTVALTSGCSSTQTPQTVITPARVQSISRLAAYVSARTVLVKRPEAKADLLRAQAGLAALVKAERWDAVAAVDVLLAADLKALQSEEGLIALTALPLLVDAAGGGSVDLRGVDYARAFIEGADAGLTLALGR